MSKKILKRSLALGALMAFVITGQAWAAVVENTSEIARDQWKGPVKTELKKSEDCEGGVTHTSNTKYAHCDLAGNKLTITGYINDEGTGGTQREHDCFTGFKIEDTGMKGTLEIKNDNGGTLSGIGTIDVGTLDIYANGGHAIHANVTRIQKFDGEEDLVTDGITINANTVNLKSVDDSVIHCQGAVLNLGSGIDKRIGSLTIDAKEGLGAFRIADADSAVNVYANELNIYKTEKKVEEKYKGIRVTDGAELTIDAESGLIDTGFMVEDNNTSVVLTLGKDATLKGNFEVTGGAAATLDLSGTWELSDAVNKNGVDNDNSLTNATFRNGSTFVIDGATYENNDGKNVSYALNGVGDKATLTVENGAKLTVTGIDYNTYNIAKDFATISENKWQVNDLNTLMEGKWVEDTENKTLQLEVVAKDAQQMATEMGVSESTGETINKLLEDANDYGVENANDGTPKGKLVGLANAMEQSGNSVVAGKAMEAVQKMAEAGGNSATAAKVVTNVTGVTNQRLSFSGGNAGGNKGGHGVGLLEEGSGAAIWAQYVHGKDEVEDMPSTAGASSYEGQYNGIVMGVDFKKVGKFQSGIAFNYGEGDTNSVNTTSPTRSEYDFWGIGYYGNIRNADSNVIFDIGYAQTDSDVTSDVLGQTFEASPETTTWTAGVKVEKLYQNNNVQIVPYTGLRYMSIDADDYTTKCGATSYNMQRQDIWMLPVGVSIKQEIVNKNGWVVTPKVDLSYIWAFGDTDSEMEFATAFDSKTNIGYDVMDDGSWMGLVGVEAAMDDWTFGVSYSYQKGDHSESKKWYVDAKYSF